MKPVAMEPAPTSLPERVRTAAAGVAERATLVRIDDDALDRLLGVLDPAPPDPLPEEAADEGDDEAAVAGLLAWDAVNFGSGWFPHVTKLPGRSGARTLATMFQAHRRAHGPPTAEWLAAVDRATVAEVFAQPTTGEVVGLLDAFAGAWRELGAHLLEHHDGSALALVDAAGGSATGLAGRLAELPAWRDTHDHDGHEVPLCKRAQIVPWHLASALAGRAPGRFDDLDRLTMFADNLVPHVLRHHGVLTVDDALAARIEAGDLLEHGERGEVELRAVAIHAVERLVAGFAERGVATTAPALDSRLWVDGQDPVVKTRPRHRCRCTSY